MKEHLWLEMSVSLREVLKSDGCTPDAIEWIIGDLRPRWLELLAKSPTVPVFEKRATKPLIDSLIHRNSRNALVQMVRLEVELFELKFGRSVVTPEKQAEWNAAFVPEPDARVN